MKQFLLIILLIGFTNGSAQMATTDVGATAQLTTIAGVLKQVSDYQKEISERMETIDAIKEINNVVDLVEILSQTYCVIQDYDLSLSLNPDRVSSCFYDFETALNMNIIETSLSQITSAITNTTLSLEERSNMVTNAVNGIKKSSEEINKEKEELEAVYREKKAIEDMIRFYSN